MTKRQIEKVEIVTHTELAGILGGLSGATIISLTWQAKDPARYKRDQGRITKLSHFSGMVNARYDRKKAKAMGIPLNEVHINDVPWRERVGDTPLLRHKTKGTVYVEFYPKSGSTQFTLDGNPCERDNVRELVKPPSKGGAGVVYRTPILTSVSAAKIQGISYQVIPDHQEA